MTRTLFRYSQIAIFWLVGLVLAEAPSAEAQVDSVADSATVEIKSSPVGGFIFLNGRDFGTITPAELRVPAGEHLIEIIIEGYEPLAKRLGLEAAKHTRLEFVLKSLPPPPLTADSIGFARLPQISLLDEKMAVRLEKKWTGLAEIFAIVPLGQGILARLVLPKEHHSAANSMVLTGLGLTAGSYLLGKVLGKRKLHQVRTRNEEIPRLNDEIRLQNQEANQAVQAANSQNVKAWMAENEGRGVVTVTVE